MQNEEAVKKRQWTVSQQGMHTWVFPSEPSGKEAIVLLLLLLLLVLPFGLNARKSSCEVATSNEASNNQGCSVRRSEMKNAVKCM
eukprot:913838-Pelagomonas_calceolata.AAC.1